MTNKYKEDYPRENADQNTGADENQVNLSEAEGNTDSYRHIAKLNHSNVEEVRLRFTSNVRKQVEGKIFITPKGTSLSLQNDNDSSS